MIHFPIRYISILVDWLLRFVTIFICVLASSETEVIKLSSIGEKFINSSHVVIKRKPNTPGELADGEKIAGVYAASGVSSFNSTHIIKTSDENITTAIISVSKRTGDRSIASNKRRDESVRSVSDPVCDITTLVCTFM